MSVLIKGMEMPTSCMLCPFCVEEADPANGEMCMVTGTLMPPCTRERLDNCPLIEIPPHGRLIDADDLLATVHSAMEDDDMYEDDYRDVRDWLAVAPTVIEAEGGDEE